MMTREEYNREYRSLADARDVAVKAGDQKTAKLFRQRISKLYEDHGKDLKEAKAEPDEAEQDRRDAERYRKLKVAMESPCRTLDGSGFSLFIFGNETYASFDAAVDALPDIQAGKERG